MVLPARVNAIALPPLAGPAAVLGYLSRDTHHTAIGNDGVVASDGVEFIGRFLRHVLPLGFERIRHCGILAAAHKARALAAARAALAMPAVQPPAHDSAARFMRRVQRIDIECCAHCRARWHVVQTAAADWLALHELPPLPRAAPCAPGGCAALA